MSTLYRCRISAGSIREHGFRAGEHISTCRLDNKKSRRVRNKFRKRDVPVDHGRAHDEVSKFIEDRCDWTDRTDASHITLIKKAIAEHCGIRVRDVSMILTFLNIKSEARATAAGGRMLTRSGINSVRAGNTNCLRLLPK